MDAGVELLKFITPRLPISSRLQLRQVNRQFRDWNYDVACNQAITSESIRRYLIRYPPLFATLYTLPSQLYTSIYPLAQIWIRQIKDIYSALNLELNVQKASSPQGLARDDFSRQGNIRDNISITYQMTFIRKSMELDLDLYSIRPNQSPFINRVFDRQTYYNILNSRRECVVVDPEYASRTLLSNLINSYNAYLSKLRYANLQERILETCRFHAELYASGYVGNLSIPTFEPVSFVIDRANDQFIQGRDDFILLNANIQRMYYLIQRAWTGPPR